MELYRHQSSMPKVEAQQNLSGRTHYVDDSTLKFHHSKVLSAHVTDNGLLFAIVTSDALDMNNTKRGFRFVVFDLFGTVLERTSLEGVFSTREKARKAMWAAVNAIDAKAVTLAAIDRAKHNFACEMEDLRAKVTALETAVPA